MKRVWKFATGVDIPEGAVYLSTQVEKIIKVNVHADYGDQIRTEQNALVWHYFLVDVDENGKLTGERVDGRLTMADVTPEKEDHVFEHSMHCCCPTCISPPRK